MNNVKIWTIKVLVDVNFLYCLDGKGTWESPVGGNRYFGNEVHFIASNNADDLVYANIGYDFKLQVKPGDEIQWIVEAINSTNQESVVMYGFNEGSNWEENLGIPGISHSQHPIFQLKQGFNDTSMPKGNYLKQSWIDIDVPNAEVKETAKKNDTIAYHLKILLVDSEAKVLKFVQIDPVFEII